MFWGVVGCCIGNVLLSLIVTECWMDGQSVTDEDVRYCQILNINNSYGSVTIYISDVVVSLII